MPRSYFRTLPDLYERKAFGTDAHPPYPPAALACFLGVLCFGEQQFPRGRFKSHRLLVVLLAGPHGKGAAMARQVQFLLQQGDLIELPDGSLYIEGWDELQEGNWQVAERMARYRARLHGVTPGVTAPVTPVVTPAVTGGVTGDPSRVVGEEVGSEEVGSTRHLAVGRASESANGFDVGLWTKTQCLAEELTGVPHALTNPYSGFGAMALSQATAVSWETFEGEWRRIAAVYGKPTAKQLTFDGEVLLRPTGRAVSTVLTKEAKAMNARNATRASLGMPPVEGTR